MKVGQGLDRAIQDFSDVASPVLERTRSHGIEHWRRCIPSTPSLTRRTPDSFRVSLPALAQDEEHLVVAPRIEAGGKMFELVPEFAKEVAFRDPGLPIKRLVPHASAANAL